MAVTMRKRLGLTLMILAPLVCYLTVHPPQFGLNRSRGLGMKALRKAMLKRIGLAWDMARQDYEVFPADDIERFARTYCGKGLSRTQALTRFWHYDHMRSFAKWAWGITVAAVLSLAGLALWTSRLRRYLRASVITGILSLLLAFALVLPLWRWLLVPREGYEYLNDFLYVRGVSRDAPPTAIVAHGRWDLHPGDVPVFVLFVDSRIEEMAKPQLREILREQEAQRRPAKSTDSPSPLEQGR